MKCRQCGIDIADKALVCYKCGTATTEAKYQPAPLPRASSRGGLIATVLALALLAAAVLYLERTPATSGSPWITYAAVAAAVVIVAIRAYARRR